MVGNAPLNPSRGSPHRSPFLARYHGREATPTSFAMLIFSSVPTLMPPLPRLSPPASYSGGHDPSPPAGGSVSLPRRDISSRILEQVRRAALERQPRRGNMPVTRGETSCCSSPAANDREVDRREWHRRGSDGIELGGSRSSSEGAFLRIRGPGAHPVNPADDHLAEIQRYGR